MELTYGEYSTPGKRPNNEDKLGFYQPQDPEERLALGALVMTCDGVGGLGEGEVASNLAVETGINKFKEIKERSDAKSVIWHVINSANVAVYDEGMKKRDSGRMATTCTASLYRNNEVTIGHVGDCRVYLIQDGQIRRLTTDHSYAGLQVKMGLISEAEAMGSAMRCVLTRNLGQNPTVQIDFYSVTVHSGDRLVQCTDGLHSCITEPEILEIAMKQKPADACKNLVALAEKRGSDDNISVQIVHIEQVNQVMFYRGLPMYHKEDSRTNSNEIQVGQTLDNRFEIIDVISRGGMACVFKAIDKKTGQTVAIKAPFMRYESDPAFFTRFQREEDIGKLLDHPSILKIIPVEEKTRPYMVMEFLEGQTLDQLLQLVSPLPVGDALKFASRICDALDYMHKKNIVHRDLKPQNIMVCNDGTLRIMDFGIAKAAGQRRITFVGFSPAMGTPDYMAPEQVKGKRGDERTDIYSLGAILYEMVTGETPFEGANAYVVMNARLTGDPIAPRRINKNVSAEVEEIILHAMRRHPAERYPDAVAMKAELDAPENVKVTGLHERLQAPTLTMPRNWLKYAVYAMVPVMIFMLLYILTRHH